MIPEYGSHVPEDKDQYLVITPYGPGLVIRTRKIHPQSSGRISSGRSEIVVLKEIELTGWSNSSSSTIDTDDRHNDATNRSGRPVRPAMLYTAIDYPTITPTVGSDVMCPFGLGRGRVLELVRRNVVVSTETATTCEGTDSNKVTTTAANSGTVNTMTFVVVRLSSWRLAGRSTVTCYWNIHMVRTVRHKHIYEMSIVEKIEYANELKQIAATHFQQKEYVKAIHHYERAVQAVKYVQHNTDSTNTIRADLLLVMITCCNNSATCYMQLVQQQQDQQKNINETTNSRSSINSKNEYYEKAYQHAQQALSLIETLEAKKGGRIHQELLHLDSCNDVRIFGEWKIKSLYIIASISYTKYDRVEDAMTIIHKARDLITTLTKDQNCTKHQDTPTNITTTTTVHEQQRTKILVQLRKKDRELIKLYHQCKERQKDVLKIEKLRAQAMFATSKHTTISTTTTTTTTSSCSSRTSTPIASNVSTSSNTTTATNNINDNNNNNDVTAHSPPSSTTTTTTTHKLSSNIQNNEEEKKSDGMILSSLGHTKNATAAKDEASIDDDDDDKMNRSSSNDAATISTDLPWHQDPYVLTGLGVVIGTIGTMLVLSQLMMLPTSSKR